MRSHPGSKRSLYTLLFAGRCIHLSEVTSHLSEMSSVWSALPNVQSDTILPQMETAGQGFGGKGDVQGCLEGGSLNPMAVAGGDRDRPGKRGGPPHRSTSTAVEEIV